MSDDLVLLMMLFVLMGGGGVLTGLLFIRVVRWLEARNVL